MLPDPPNAATCDGSEDFGSLNSVAARQKPMTQRAPARRQRGKRVPRGGPFPQRRDDSRAWSEHADATEMACEVVDRLTSAELVFGFASGALQVANRNTIHRIVLDGRDMLMS